MAVAMTNHQRQSDNEYDILSVIEKKPDSSQREIAKEIGVSLGKTNFIIKSLIDKGFIKLSNFRRSDNKIAYLYFLTPNGISEKSRLARSFLTRKISQYEDLENEIETLRKEINE